MSYDYRHIVRNVRRLLRRDLSLSLEVVSTTLAVDRHTAMRALRQYGSSFMSVKDNLRRANYLRLQRDVRQFSAKEKANMLGFRSVRGFRKWLRSNPTL